MTRLDANEAPVLLDPVLDYEVFARHLQESCMIGDPWYDGHEIFHASPLLLKRKFLDTMYGEATRVGQIFDELCQIVLAESALLDSFFCLPPFYKLMWLASEGFWHGFARMDLFWLEDGGFKIAELNADTPSGQIEAVLPPRLLAPHTDSLVDVNAEYEERFWQLCRSVHLSRCGEERPLKRVLILYPTDLAEDNPLIRLYQKWFEARGLEVELGSPFNLQRTDEGGIAVFGKRIDLVLRHYKTDWWGERPRIFDDEAEVPDAEPLQRELLTLLDAERNAKVTVINPFGALLPQNKRSMAFMWEEMHRFSEAGQAAIRDLIPETRRLEGFDPEQLKREKDDWVLKSDFGCEGDEVLVGAFTDMDTWHRCIEHALPGIWVAQRFFRIRPFQNALPNYGVYLIAGQPAGVLVRLAEPGVTTGHDARVISAFVSPDEFNKMGEGSHFGHKAV